jgi:hypothetical protein
VNGHGGSLEITPVFGDGRDLADGGIHVRPAHFDRIDDGERGLFFQRSRPRRPSD